MVIPPVHSRVLILLDPPFGWVVIPVRCLPSFDGLIVFFCCPSSRSSSYIILEHGLGANWWFVWKREGLQEGFKGSDRVGWLVGFGLKSYRILSYRYLGIPGWFLGFSNLLGVSFLTTTGLDFMSTLVGNSLLSYTPVTSLIYMACYGCYLLIY